MKSMIRHTLVILPMVMMSFAVHASSAQHLNDSKYAGQENRSIKSLSPDDIAELKRGGGWGLAKAAELNGVPGPVHLLEMKTEILLSDAQVLAITELYKKMKTKAIKQGEKLIWLEGELESHFQNRTITDEILRASLEAIAEARSALRYVHLATHLQTPEILSPDQVDKYNKLRGYGQANPCANMPKGHDAEMWRKHNGCK